MRRIILAGSLLIACFLGAQNLLQAQERINLAYISPNAVVAAMFLKQKSS